jgi:hypothetical protein
MTGGCIFGTNAGRRNLSSPSRLTSPRYMAWTGIDQTPRRLFHVLSIRESTSGIILQRSPYNIPSKLASQYGELATPPSDMAFSQYLKMNQVISIFTTLAST